MLQKVVGLLVILLATWAGSAASAESATAYATVQATTTQVMDVVQAAPEYFEEDPDRYYAALQEVLDQVVDFSGFTRGVMGPYATKSRYQSLSPEGKAQLREQVERFTEVMRQGLVRTYGKGLLAFGGSRVEVQRPGDDAVDEGKATVTQLIFSEGPEPYVILYQMRRSKNGDWMLRNLIVEAINLGKVYRNQFQASARDYEGDLDAVIDNWSVDEDDLEKELGEPAAVAGGPG